MLQQEINIMSNTSCDVGRRKYEKLITYIICVNVNIYIYIYTYIYISVCVCVCVCVCMYVCKFGCLLSTLHIHLYLHTSQNAGLIFLTIVCLHYRKACRTKWTSLFR